MVKEPTALQLLARKRNWALFQIKSARGNLVHVMAQMGMDTAQTHRLFIQEEERIK